MTAPWMPPLPEPDVIVHYTAARMRRAQADAARAALEQAAKICDSVDNHSNPMTATDCADAIRALAKEIAP